MSQQRLPMRKVRDVLRLKAVGLGKRKIAASLGISATAVGGCLRRAREAGVAWPLAEEMTDEALEARLYPASVALAEVAARRPLPDWPTIHRELKRPGVTLQLLWGEHRAAHPDGYGTVGSAISTGRGSSVCHQPCGRRMWPARSCLSITPARPCR